MSPSTFNWLLHSKNQFYRPDLTKNEIKLHDSELNGDLFKNVTINFRALDDTPLDFQYAVTSGLNPAPNKADPLAGPYYHLSVQIKAKTSTGSAPLQKLNLITEIVLPQ